MAEDQIETLPANDQAAATALLEATHQAWKDNRSGQASNASSQIGLSSLQQVLPPQGQGASTSIQPPISRPSPSNLTSVGTQPTLTTSALPPATPTLAQVNAMSTTPTGPPTILAQTPNPSPPTASSTQAAQQPATTPAQLGLPIHNAIPPPASGPLGQTQTPP